MAQLATSAVWAAKQELRRKLRSALTAMTEKQRQKESDVLTKKVGFMNFLQYFGAMHMPDAVRSYIATCLQK